MKNLLVLAVSMIFLSSCKKDKSDCITCDYTVVYDNPINSKTYPPQTSCNIEGEAQGGFYNPYTGQISSQSFGEHVTRLYDNVLKDSLTYTANCTKD